MTNSEDMQAVITQVAIQAVTMVVRAIGKADLPTEAHTRRSSSEKLHKARQAGPMLS